MIIYLASPYSHPDDSVREENYNKIAKLAAKMVSEGHVVMSPIAYGHNLLPLCKMPSDWLFWKNFCLTFLDKCEEIIVYKMEGWENSTGVKEEIEFAKSKGIKITYKEEENV
jgi:hypothetical protein